MRRFSIWVLLFLSGFAVLPCRAADVYRQLVPLPRGIVPAKVAARVPIARLKSPEVTFGAVAGPVDGDIGCGVGAVFKTAPAHVADQAYRIDIGPDGVKVVAGGEAGARYARVTLDQLAKLGEGGTVPAGAIIDWPALKWRGIMNDCGRNFLDLEGVKAIVDLAARYKLNLFHWHLSEYHGWRLESKRYPKLTAPETMLRQIGKYYSQDDFRAVVAYAAERGVTVMPELDVPGHSLALRKGLGVESMKDPRVDRAVSDLLDELCTLAPKDVMPFIHLGTDEVRVTPERVDAGQCSRWAEVVAKNGRIAVGWAPGERMSSSGEIVDMVWEGGHPTNSTHRCFDAADFYFGSLGPELILNQAQFTKPCDWAIAPERKLGAIACCWHDDAVGEDTMRLFRNTVFAPALVAFADNFWLGRPKREPQFFTRLPPHGSMALGYTEYFENRLLAQRDKVLKDCPLPFPYVRQTQYRWRVTDGTGRVIDGCYPGGLFDVDSFVTNRTGLVVAETWIESQEDRTVGAWIDFEKTGTTHVRSFNRPRPKLGEWSPLGSTVEVNGEKVAPPAWRHPGVYANFDKLPKDGHCWLYRDVPYSDEVCETPIDDEWHFVREPTRIRLRKGWNHVKLTMPKDVDALEPVWRGVFLLVEGSSERPREARGLRFSSDPQPEGATPLDVQGLLDRARSGETVRIAAGAWQTKPFRLRSDVTLALDEGAVVYASTDIRDYSETAGQRYFIGAVGVTNAAIVGKGVFDGCGQQFNFEEVLAGESQPQKLPVMMRFIRCKDLRLEGFTYRNGGAWGCHLCNCDGVTVRGLTCFNHSNRTNDGIDIESSNVLIEDCDIDADDDAIVLKAETDIDFPVTNVVVRNCRLASSCNAFKFGTGSYNVFRDVLLENCEFVPPKGNFVRGIRPSDSGEWTLTGIAGMALEVCDGGSMENVTIRNVTVRGYLTPVFVRLERRHAPRGGRETYLRNVLIENVRGRAESPIASSITGVPGLRPRGITLRNCDFTFPGGGTAKDAAMPVSECETAYPDCTMFDNRRLPAWGFYIRHADNVRFENVKLTLAGPDARERIVTDDCTGFAEASADAATAVWLDELDLSEMSTGWGVAKKDRSIAGLPLTLGTNVYARGVGTHAKSELTVRLDGKALAFDAMVGVDRGAEKPGVGVAAVRFAVRAAGRVLAESPVMKTDDPPFALHADLTGAEKVELVADDAGAPDADHADWCDARFTMRAGAKPAAVAPFDKLLGVLSPRPGPEPRINGPAVYGVRPAHPILFRLPVSGARPMKFSVSGLPDGVRFDAEKGILSGAMTARGTYTLKLSAENAHGTAVRDFRIVVGDRIALTPPMGWNSWNCFAHTVTDRNIRETADALERTGLADHGWCYVNIDDFWQHRVGETDDETLRGPERNPDGTIAVNRRFPSMRALADSVHAKGFKIGLYSSPGPTTCGKCAGSWKHEWQDAKTYADWGFDYLKYDWCGYADVVSKVGSGLAAQTLPYRLMGGALAAQDRDIVFSICQYGRAEVSTWGTNVGGNCWRTTQDITDTWSSMFDILQRQAELWPYAGPGSWNDPDMLVVGRLGWGELRPTRLKTNEQYTHMSFWCVLCAPLLIGCDLGQLDELTLSLLTNDEVLETNQDELGAQAARVQGCELAEVWAKPMSDGSFVFALLNKTTDVREVTVELAKLGVLGSWRVRDLWRRKDLGTGSVCISREVYPHATELLRLHPVDADSRLDPGLRDIRDNATYRHFDGAAAKDGCAKCSGRRPGKSRK